MKPQINFSVIKKTGCCILYAAVLAIFFSSCTSKSERPIIIWTNRNEFVPYTEVFNASQDKVKAIIVYKENPAAAIPATRDETPPDLVVGTSLRTEHSLRYFRSLNYLFSSQEVHKNDFYQQLLNACKNRGFISLIPVSFNLPAVIFSTANGNLINDNYMLSLNQIRTLASSYNEKNDNNLYTKMGFAPQWNKDFLYLSAVLEGSDFHEKGTTFSWNKEALESAVKFLRTWTIDANTSSSDEQDFSFKYLYTPGYKQVLSKRCLFSYITSDQLFSLTAEQLNSIDFRWIHKDNKIPMAESMITLGLYKKAKNKKGAEQFISWFFNEATQKKLLDHTRKMHLNIMTFGISGGFSSIKNVNERIFPAYYSSLLANIPAASYIEPSPVLPLGWSNFKNKVVIPYLSDAINTSSVTSIKSMENRITDWHKQYF